MNALVAVAVGNSRLRFGAFEGSALQDVAAADLANIDDAARRIVALAAGGAPIVMATVNSGVADALERALVAENARVYRIGRDLAIDMNHTLDDARTVGHDRLLCALGAFDLAQQACIVIDAGTAVTVDFVDGEGAFHGGAIAPGACMMLGALHTRAPALPHVDFAPLTSDTPFGKDTPGAMLRGVHAAITGMVHLLIDEYARFYDAYPRIVATGGDAAALFDGDELVEHIVPDLQLMGLRVASMRALEQGPKP